MEQHGVQDRLHETSSSFPPGSEPDEVKRKAVRGGFSLLIRQGLGHLIVVFGNILLARLLVPEDLVSMPLSCWWQISHTLRRCRTRGFPHSVEGGASLEDWRAIFTFQQILVVTFALIIFFAAPLIRDYYEWSSSTPWFIRVTVLSLMITSFRTIPAAPVGAGC